MKITNTKITNMKIPFNEQETVITFEAATGEWDFYTCVPAHIQLFTDKMIDLSNDVEVLTEWEGIPTSIRFKLENDWINTKQIIKKKRVKREMTDEQRQALQNGRKKLATIRNS